MYLDHYFSRAKYAKRKENTTRIGEDILTVCLKYSYTD
jgi:hypothetical protein